MPYYQVCLKLYYAPSQDRSYCSYYVVDTTALNEVAAGRRAAREILRNHGEYCHNYDIDHVVMMIAVGPTKVERTYQVYVSSDLVSLTDSVNRGLTFMTEYVIRAGSAQLADKIATMYHKRDWSHDLRNQSSYLSNTQVTVTWNGQDITTAVEDSEAK